jgi:CDGSH-type Zn-finger protein
VKTPQPLLVTLVKDGPIKFSGYLRIHNARGQECLSRSGALCRCGRSARKPFCDCQ